MGLFKRKTADDSIEIKVTGLHCGHCEMSVRNALLKVDGVKDAEVSQADERARVTTTKDVPVDALVDAVVAAGYGAEPGE